MDGIVTDMVIKGTKLLSQPGNLTSMFLHSIEFSTHTTVELFGLLVHAKELLFLLALCLHALDSLN